MKLLLDTHIWIWSVSEPAKLARSVRQVLAADSTELWLSPVSLWELTLLVEKGRIALSGDYLSWFEEAMRLAPMKEAPLTHAIVSALSSIETPHSDPADRLLAATAATLDIQLVTADKRLLAGRGYPVLPNHD